MANDFYNPSGYPTPFAFGSSSGLRAELNAVSAGFDKLPALTGNAYRIPYINASGDGLTSSSTFVLNSSGNVGIGTSSPATKLEVAGSGPTLRINGNSGTVPRLELSSAGVVAWTLRSNSAGASDFSIHQEGTGERLRIDSSGNLGVGATSPTAKMDVVGPDDSGVQYRTGSRTVGVGSVSGEAALYWGSTTALTFFSGSERMRIDSSGNLGVGTASPECRTQIAFTSTAPSLSGSTGAGLSLLASNTLRINLGSDPITPFGGWIQTSNGAGSSFPLLLNPLGGNVGVGTANPAGRLHVKTTSTAIPAVLDTSADTAPSYTQFRVNASAGWEVGMSQASEGYDFRWCYGAFGTGNSRLRLDSSGNLIQRLQGAVPTLNNQEAVLTFPNNSTLRITFKGTDGTSRSIDLALT